MSEFGERQSSPEEYETISVGEIKKYLKDGYEVEVGLAPNFGQSMGNFGEHTYMWHEVARVGLFGKIIIDSGFEHKPIDKGVIVQVRAKKR